MSEMTLKLKSLRNYHTQPLIDYRRGNPLTHHLLNVLLDHVLNGYVPQHLDPATQKCGGTYRILLLSQPHEPELHKTTQNLPSFVANPYRRWVPKVEVEAPELLNLQAKAEEKWHAVVASTRLEHESDAMRSLIGLHERLEDNGCLMVVTHMPEGSVPATLERDGTNLRLSFEALQDFAKNRLSRRNTAERLRQFDFHHYAGVKALSEWLEEFKTDPAARHIVADALRHGAFSNPMAVARDIRARSRTPYQWASMLEDAGFHVHPPAAFEVGSEAHPVFFVAAYKGRCPSELNATGQ
ncbi:hypothetical protein HYV43_03905 [Candidatus Micrarchaeota archaeon]|nr:hypothetical protein [Candidatus Micrarchaeota archaeon]